MFGKKDENKISRPAVEFVDRTKNESYSRPAMVSIENDINGVTRFAISKLTENGKYMRGKLLYYKLNGVEVYTDSNNIIFVDTVQNQLFIREHDHVFNEISPEDPENKKYIILYTDLGFDEDSMEQSEFALRWESVTGRKQAYENIKVNAPIIDIDKSIVLTETVSLKDALSVRQFAEYIKNAELIKDDTFDINDYIGGEYK
ncbi:MAG: hypothetical protein IKR19_09045 [Acholeplasmatales bacterium]|nr:hypothetical protein [Acholeplasmatales bacterium]